MSSFLVRTVAVASVMVATDVMDFFNPSKVHKKMYMNIFLYT